MINEIVQIKGKLINHYGGVFWINNDKTPNDINKYILYKFINRCKLAMTDYTIIIVIC